MNFIAIYDLVLPLLFAGITVAGLAIYLGARFSAKK
jgi:hypothetical protein